MIKKTVQDKGLAQIGLAAILMAAMVMGMAGCQLEQGDGPLSSSVRAVAGVKVNPVTWSILADSTATGTDEDLNGVAFNPAMGQYGRYIIASGGSETAWVAYSNDLGDDWNTAATQPTIPRFLTTANYANGYFFTSTGGRTNTTSYFAYSTDGDVWNSLPVTTIGFGSKGFLYDGSKYLISGQDGQIAYSTGGGVTSWTTLDSDATTFDHEGDQQNRYINALAYGVVTGDITVYVAGGAHGHTAVSGDGTAWALTATTGGVEDTEIIFDDGATATDYGFINGIAFGNSVYVAVGGIDNTTPKVAYSNDGSTWTEVTQTYPLGEGPATATAIAYGNGYFVVTTNIGTVYYSTNALTWYAANPTPLDEQTINDIKYIPAPIDRFVAAGEKGTLIISN